MLLLPQTPTAGKARVHRAYLALGEAILDGLEHAKLFFWADSTARIRTLILVALVMTGLGAAALVAAVTRYGEETGPAPRSAIALAAADQPLPESPLELTLSPDQLRALSPEDARTVNASIRISLSPNPPATVFLIPANALASVDFTRAVDCMTAAIYYEAPLETAAGQSGVAQVVLNRTRNSAYPSTVCAVVFQGAERQSGCQFSFTCDGALARLPDPARWEIARSAAIAALSGSVAPAVGNATHYHADYVSPYWAPKLVKVGQIGAHIFYRWPGGAGLPASFSRAYTGGEPVIGKLGRLLGAKFGYVPPPAIEEIDADAALSPPQIELTTHLTLPPKIVAQTPTPAPAPEEAATPVVVAPRVQASMLTLRDPSRSDTTATAPPQRTNARIAAPSNW